jgi:hypothetical protein
MERNSVVLPDPLGPKSATYSPRPTANVTSLKATWLPNRFVRPSSLKMGSSDKIDVPLLVRAVSIAAADG